MKESQTAQRSEPAEILGPGPIPVSDEEGRQSFLIHLEELRWRALRSFLYLGIGSALVFRSSGRILDWILQPVGQVVFLSPAEPFMVHLKVACFGGLVLAAPLVAWEVWGFLNPALFQKERHGLLLLVPISTGLFFTGVWFAWDVLLPISLKFLMSFSSDRFIPMLTVGHYVSFVGWMAAAGGLFFQMPLAVWVLARMGIVSPAGLLRHWRLALVVILVLSAVLTPTPDVATQLLLAAPMSALYLISAAAAWGMNRKRRRVET